MSEEPGLAGESAANSVHRDSTHAAGQLASSPLTARLAADLAAIDSDPYLRGIFASLSTSIDDLAAARWAPRGSHVVAAAVRVLAREQARLDAARLRLLHEVESRDDVVPRARAGSSKVAAFLRASVGTDLIRARRDADAASLIWGLNGDTADGSAGDGADLARVGAAYSAGEISRDHVDIAMRTRARLGAARSAVVPVADPSTGEVTERRCMHVVDAVLAEQARRFSVPEFARIADRLVEDLNPPDPADAHRRRYLHLSRLADGSVRGRFALGPAQALTLTSVLAALAAPRPGKAVDADGVEHDLPDDRDAAQRRADALIEAIAHHQAGVAESRTTAGRNTNHDSGRNPDDSAADSAVQHPGRAEAICGAGQVTGGDADADVTCDTASPFTGVLFDDGVDDPEPFESDEPPESEGRLQVRRPPGMRSGPYPDVEITVTATLEQLAHARLHHDGFDASPPDGSSIAGSPDRGTGATSSGAGGSPGKSSPAARPLLGGFARAAHGEHVHPSVLGLLACSARIRRVVLDAHGAVLHLGRTRRLATTAQRAALHARDGGCVIPGCTVSGNRCEIHHVVAWADGGDSDIDNLVLVCPIHHIEVTNGGSWEIEMCDGTPWARPPAWVHPARPLLRNASHRDVAR